MADDVVANSGSGGATFATDDDSTRHHPYVKLEFGADNTYTKVSDTDPLPIDIKEYGSAAVAAGNAVHVQPGTAASFTVAQTTATNLKASVEQATAASLKAQTDAQGRAAHDAPVSGNPVLSGGESRTTNPTAVGDGDAVRLMADSLGKLIVQLGAPTALQLNGKSTMTDTSADDIIGAQGAGVKVAVMGVLVTNGSVDTPADVNIRAATTAKITGHCAINGGGFALSGGGFPLFITGANEAVTAISSATADIDVFAWGYAVTN